MGKGSQRAARTQADLVIAWGWAWHRRAWRNRAERLCGAAPNGGLALLVGYKAPCNPRIADGATG